MNLLLNSIQSNNTSCNYAYFNTRKKVIMAAGALSSGQAVNALRLLGAAPVLPALAVLAAGAVIVGGVAYATSPKLRDATSDLFSDHLKAETGDVPTSSSKGKEGGIESKPEVSQAEEALRNADLALGNTEEVADELTQLTQENGTVRSAELERQETIKAQGILDQTRAKVNSALRVAQASPEQSFPYQQKLEAIGRQINAVRKSIPGRKAI
jgi:hypothetical protein